MLYARGPLRTLQIAAILAIASASTIRPSGLFARDDTCPADFERCTESGLSGTFCCSTGSSCLVLAGGTTVLCCPENGDGCTVIQTISCNVSLQDPKTHPKAGIKTTEQDKELAECGRGCCPFGYHCNEKNVNCVKDTDQSKKPGETPLSSSLSLSSSKGHSSTTTAHTSSSSIPSTLKTSIATSVPASISTSTTTAAIGGDTSTAIPSKDTPSSTTTRNHNIAAIVGGIAGGIAVLGLLIAGIFLLRHRRANKAVDSSKKHDSTSSFGNIISAPIPHADYHSQRLDFLAKAQSSGIAQTPTQAQPRFPPPSPKVNSPPQSPYSQYSPYSIRPESQMSELPPPRSQHASPRSYHPSAEIGGLRSLTGRYSTRSSGSSSPGFSNPFASRGERQNSAGSESINIFADPSDVGTPSMTADGYKRDTTWTEFQSHAGERGAPPSPVRRR
ncbi:hypothetical protein GGS20DRAFT_485977 [Poronia punctata]|nr:hypothetical protein GGS20DRAFT_485977 [Poronia punctata]